MKHLATVVLFFFVILVQAQNKRPVVGLCLSGGGAKGFSHIGVLHIIDSLGIPIDYVTGTSMGSIIGGLYAIGYEPEQIANEVTHANWSNLLDQNPIRKYEPIGMKDHSKRNLLTLGFSDWKVSLPTAINNANKLFRKLEEVTIGYHGERDFTKFPRGFVCIAADLHTGEKIVFHQGSLPDAMRASMSIPSMFAPHKYKGMTLVDGGTINNFPTDELIKLGCDIIIGVDLQTTLSDTTNVSITKVLEKTAMFTNNRENPERQALCDILIKPDLSGYSSQDFGKGAGLINRGEKAAREHLDELTILAKRLNNYQQKHVQVYQKRDTIQISNVKVKGLEWVSERFIHGTLDIESGQKTTVHQISESMSALYGSSYFDQVSYNLVQEENDGNSYVLKVRVQENQNDLDIGVGLHHDPDFGTSALVNLYARNALIKGSRFSLDLILAPSSRFHLIYEVDRGLNPGFGIRSDLYFTRPKMYDIEKNYFGQYNYNSSSSAVYGLLSLNNLAGFRAGLEHNWSLIDLRDITAIRELLDSTGTNPDATKFSFNVLNLFVEFNVDNQDQFDFPTKGHSVYLVARYHSEFENYLEDLLEVNYMTAYLRYKVALSTTDWLAFLPRIDAGVSLFGNSDFPYLFQLGGLGLNYFNYQVPFPGYHYMEGIGLANVVSGQLEIRSRLFKHNYLSAIGGYAIFNSDAKSLTLQPDGHQLAGLGVKYSIDTFFGPVALTAHRSFIHGTQVLFYFNLGFWF